MPKVPTSSDRRLRPPAWLVLLALLFVAAQCLGAVHSLEHQTDTDCALCVLSSAVAAAAVASGWVFALGIGTAVFHLVALPRRRRAGRFHDSRAPPHPF